MAAGLSLTITLAQGLVLANQRPPVRANGAGVLPDVTNVINSARQKIEFSILDGLESGYLELGVAGDFFQADSADLTDGRGGPTFLRQRRHDLTPFGTAHNAADRDCFLSRARSALCAPAPVSLSADQPLHYR